MMAEYDVYNRTTGGLDSETIGSYSYSKSVNVLGIGYPADIASGLMPYKRPRVR
jgi:hypothetical protein